MKDLRSFPDAHLRIFDRPPFPAPEDLSDVYLIGICGTGMGSLAGLLKQAGYAVRGADQAAYPPMSTRLAAMDIPVLEGYDAAHLDPPPSLVVVGNACTPTHEEAAYAREQGLVQGSFPEVLAEYFLEDRRSLVVAGTHGKTTTTGMLIHLLRHAGRDPGFLVGGVMIGDEVSYHVGTGPHFVVEGDEYDSAYFDKQPKFMHYRPTSAIVTSMEFDHADIYDTWEDYREAFHAFAEIIPSDGLLALNADAPEVRALAEHTDARVRLFGLAPGADVSAADVRGIEGGQRFTLVVDGTPLTELDLPMSGRHNLLNVLAAATIALDEGLTPDELAEALRAFRGMKRRQEIRGEAGGVLVLDDFAHHPTAVRETVQAVKQRWPGRRLVAIFEPRSNSSRRAIFEDAYPLAFAEADAAFLSVPAFRHNDRREDFMDISVVAERITEEGVPVVVHPNAEAMLPDLAAFLQPGDVALIMSNGDFGGLHEKLLHELAG